jgi:hypothetical protein
VVVPVVVPVVPVVVPVLVLVVVPVVVPVVPVVVPVVLPVEVSAPPSTPLPALSSPPHATAGMPAATNVARHMTFNEETLMRRLQLIFPGEIRSSAAIYLIGSMVFDGLNLR